MTGTGYHGARCARFNHKTYLYQKYDLLSTLLYKWNRCQVKKAFYCKYFTTFPVLFGCHYSAGVACVPGSTTTHNNYNLRFQHKRV